MEHADTDAKRERGRKRGPQLPGFDKTGKEVFIRFESKRVTIYTMQRKMGSGGEGNENSKVRESCQQHRTASYAKGVR